MRPILCLLALFALVGSAAAEELRLGVVAPLSDASAVLGRQVEAGASVAAATLGDIAIVAADDACTAAGGARAAREMVTAGVALVVGFLCAESIEAALPVLKQAGVPVITVGVRTDSLTDQRGRTGNLVWRLGPRADGERNAVATLLPRLWADDFFAIVDDGTIYGRELAESLRAGAEAAGLKPVFTDTYRPQLDNQIGLVGRLARAGATEVFVGGDRDDIAVMARDATETGNAIAFAGAEALRAPPGAVPLAAGTRMIALPEWADVASAPALKAFAAAGIIPEGYALPAYTAVEIAAQALDGGRPVLDALATRSFVTAIGEIRFDDKGDLADSPYRLFSYDGTRFLPEELP